MASAEQVLEIARKELGVRESPANSNRVKYNTWYYGREVSGASYPWCMAFVQWVFHQAGVSLPYKTASCNSLANFARKVGQWTDGPFQPGDVLLYDFNGDRLADHCGILEKVYPDGVDAIEGNTSISGSQSNGGQVCRKFRRYSQILGAVRPVFEEAEDMDNNPSPAHKDGVEWAVEAGLLRGNSNGDMRLHGPVTREELCTMLHRYHKRNPVA